jgi:hypothetical protein
MKKTCLLFLIGCLAVTASCAIQPKLNFYKLKSDYTTEDTKDKFTFKMPSPVIAITVQKNKDETPPWKPVITSTSKSREGMYAIKSADPWYVDTKYTIAYQQNSFLLKSLSIELTDNRLKYIQEAGSIVAAVIPLVAAVAALPSDIDKLLPYLPYNINVAECFGNTLDADDAGKMVSCKMKIKDKEGKDKDKEGKDIDWNVAIVTDRNSKNSTIPYDEFFTEGGHVSTDFPVPDCKEGFVSLEYKGDMMFVSPITFANPTKLTTVRIPAKGSITYHPICSADTVSSTADIAKPLELLKATIDQVAAAKKAFDQAKITPTPTPTPKPKP